MIDMAKALGKKDATNAMDFVTALVELQEACSVDNLKMSDFGIDNNNLEKYALNARETMGGLFEVDPTAISNDDVIEILRKSYR